MFETRPKTVILASPEDDTPILHTGLLIPQSVQRMHAHHKDRRVDRVYYGLSAVLMVLSVGVLANITISELDRNTQRATPLVTIFDTESGRTTPLPWGSQAALTQPQFFLETRDSFIEQGLTFIEVDLAALQLRYFEAGVLRHSFVITEKGTPGSWWETPAGIYETTDVSESKFSVTTQTVQPWSITFATNYVIHGEPRYPDGADVPSERADGGIRLASADAEQLYHSVRPGVPVLVHDRLPVVRPFIYNAPVADVTAAAYLVAERETGAILFAEGADSVHSIASITKLMTALVVAENLDLEKRITVSEESLVTSLIPRLSGRNAVSVYGLLQVLLVESSNEAAELLAEQLPSGEFVAAMNRKATEIGMQSTVFTDPSGLSSGNIATAYDLFALMQYIAEHRSFILDLTNSAAVKTVRVDDEFTGLVNFNHTSTTPGFRGGKVGETLAARQTSVSLHEFGTGETTRDVVVVILGTDERSADLTKLLTAATGRIQ